MADNTVQIPYTYFPDFSIGRPLFNANIYVGLPNLDASQIPTNQKSISLRLGDGTTVPVSQPVNTGSGGVISYNGSPAQIITDGEYSILVQNSSLSQVYYSRNVTNGLPITVESISTYTDFTFSSVADAIAVTNSKGVTLKLNDLISVEDYYGGLSPSYSGRLFFKVVAAGTGVADGGKYINFDNGSFQLEQNLKDTPTVKDWGAKGNGTDFDDTAILNAIAYRNPNQTVKTILFPSSVYKFQSAISYDVSQTRLVGESAILDFSSVSTGAAITLTGGGRTASGAPYLNAINPITGFEIIGAGKTASGTQGILFNDSDTQGSNDITVRDVIVHEFETGIVLGNNAYHLTFSSSSIFNTGTCFTAELFSNSGARTVFSHCRLFNSDNGLNLKNASSGSTSVTDCVIAGISTIDFRIEGGNLEVIGCDIETGNSQPSTHRVLWVNGASSYSYVSWISNNVSVKNATTVPVFGIDSPCYLRLVGGETFVNSTSTGGVFGSTGSGIGNIYTDGTLLDFGTNQLELFNGASITTNRYLPNLNSTILSGSLIASEISVSDGIIFNANKNIQVTALNTWTSLQLGTSTSGLLQLRDATSGGAATYSCDSGTGVCTQLANTIPNLSSVGYPSGVLSIQLNGGTLPRNIRPILIRV